MIKNANGNNDKTMKIMIMLTMEIKIIVLTAITTSKAIMMRRAITVTIII